MFTQTGFLSREPIWQVEDQKKGKPSKFYILYHPGQRAKEEYTRGLRLLTKQLDLPFAPAIKQAVSEKAAELTALGVSEDRAVKIAKKYTTAEINLQLDHLEHLGEIGKKPDTNIGGWLANAIEKGYEPPKGFKTREEREVQRKAEAEAEAQHQQKEIQERKITQAQEARYTALDAKLADLSEAEQQRISDETERHIRSSLEDFWRRYYLTKPFDPKSPIHRAEYYRHLTDLLES